MNVDDDASPAGRQPDEVSSGSATTGSPGDGLTASRASEESRPLTLGDDERELVLQDLDALLPTLDPQRRARFSELRAAAVSGTIPEGLGSALESLLELTLQTARARARYRAEGEQTLTRLYARTQAGRQLSAHLGKVNKALASLAGETIESLNVRMRTVGHFTIAIQTDATTITLVSRPDTIDVESIAVGN